MKIVNLINNTCIIDPKPLSIIDNNIKDIINSINNENPKFCY